MTDMGLIAVKAPRHSKMRLSELMEESDREKLAVSLFTHVLDCFLKVLPGPQVLVVSRSPTMLDIATKKGATGMVETTDGQNEALTAGARFALARGARRLVSASVDLPFLSPDDLADMLLQTRPGSVAIAPDRHGAGTNAICMAPPLAMPYRHGPGSLRHHYLAAMENALIINIVERRGLSHDIDEPRDMLNCFPPPRIIDLLGKSRS